MEYFGHKDFSDFVYITDPFEQQIGVYMILFVCSNVFFENLPVTDHSGRRGSACAHCNKIKRNVSGADAVYEDQPQQILKVRCNPE